MKSRQQCDNFITADPNCAGLGIMPTASALSGLPIFSISATGSPIVTMTPAVTMTSSITPQCQPSIPTLAGASVLQPARVMPQFSHSGSLPAKLVKRILDLEFIDMVELVPDSWRYQEEESSGCCHQSKRFRRGPVTDILLWVECYSSMIEVLCSSFPSKTPQFMAYQKTIVRAHRTFSGDGWAMYDACYRRKAAAMKSLDWAQVDFNLYNETFTGRAKAINRCKFCASEHHTSGDCVLAPEPPRRNRQSYKRYEDTRLTNYTCNLYNHRQGSRCRFNPCRFIHACSECQGSHPASQCRSKPPSNKTPQRESPVGTGRK